MSFSPYATPSLTALALAAGLLAASACAQNAAVAEPETAAPSTLALASMFSDHMVLQRDMEIPIWGKAAPGDTVQVTFDDQTHEATADDDGRWQVDLDSEDAGGPHTLTVASGDRKVEFTDVFVGDVWIASGQSNMEWFVTMAADPEAEVAAADWPQIRIIDIPNKVSDAPRDAFQSAGWQPVTPKTIGNFSAVAYYFGRELHKHLNVPIGLVGCNWGGTPMEAWTSREALETSDTFAEALEAADAEPANAEEAAQRRPQNEPAALFNGMVSPAIPYAIRGAIWYQGESNAARHAQYAELSKLMIADWRNRWGQGDFPFLLVQLAGWAPGGADWPFLREAQVDTLETPNTGMAVAIDIGHQQDIHPKNKQEVGRRLALAARAVAYGENVVYSGPMFHELTVEDGKARVAFDHVGKGLVAEGGDLKGFEIAGDDDKFVPAAATIDGATVVVSSNAVGEPTQVRYDWAPFPDGNLTNAEGLPAAPFRSNR